MFHPAEQHVGNLPARQECAIPITTAHALVRSGQYEAHGGMLPGRHFRRAVGDSCLHLRICGNRASLHWDEWDPRRFPIRHWFEVPLLAVGTMVFAAGCLGLAIWRRDG